jgi:hypothetical protein
MMNWEKHFPFNKVLPDWPNMIPRYDRSLK